MAASKQPRSPSGAPAYSLSIKRAFDLCRIMGRTATSDALNSRSRPREAGFSYVALRALPTSVGPKGGQGPT